MTSAIVYCRVSSPKQVKEGHGLGSQETRCREYAKFKNYDVIQIFQDEGVSGGMINRPGMQSMLRFLRTQKQESCVVIIDDISRLARGLEAHLELRSEIAQAGGKLESPSIEFGEDSDSLLVENLLASVSQHQRQKNAEQVKNRMRARAMNGYWVLAPFIGYRYQTVEGHGKMIVKDEPLASIVKEALESFACGRFENKVDVQRFMESHPIVPRNRNREFHLQNVENLLRRVAYAGYIHLPNWGIHYRKAKHDPLISFETWQKIQDRLDGNVKAGRRTGLDGSFPLRGFVLCDHCGRPMTASIPKGHGGHYHYYFCTTKGCPLRCKSIPKNRMEEDFEHLLNNMRPTKQLFVMFKAMLRQTWEKESLSEQESTQVLQKQLQELDKKEAQMLDRLIEAESSSLVRAYEKRVEEIDAQKIILREKIERGIQSRGSFQETFRTSLNFLENPQKLWVSGDLIAQKTVLKLAFDEKLRYRKNEGFRTALTSRPFRFFRLLSADNSIMVLPIGIEPTTPSLPRTCSTPELRQLSAGRVAFCHTLGLCARNSSPFCV